MLFQFQIGWFRQQMDDSRLIGYLQSLLDEGCLMSVTKDVN